MPTAIHKKVRACQTGANPQVIAKLQSGWLIMGDVQFLPGYCLLLPDPVVADLNALQLDKRQLFLEEMSIVGDALLAITDAARINYEILGNLEPALHGHIFPRFSHEADNLKTKPVWFYDWEAARPFDLETDKVLMSNIRDYLISTGIVNSEL